jgi:hypothetical protein
MFQALAISLMILGQQQTPHAKSAEPLPDTDCSWVIIEPKNLGEIPTIAPWPKDAENFYLVDGTHVAMDNKTSSVVNCRLQALNILPKYFAKIMEINIKEITEVEKAKADYRVSSMYPWYEVAAFVGGALVAGFVVGHFAK